MKYLNETGLSHLWEKIKAYVDAKIGSSVEWDNIQNKPPVFPPNSLCFVVETYESPSGTSIAKTSGGALTDQVISKEGYKPIGVVGTYVDKSSVTIRGAYLTDISRPLSGGDWKATIKYYVYNASASSQSVKATTRVLFVKL